VAAGEFVATSSKVATIVRIKVLKLEIQVGEKSAAGLRTGMPVVARVAAYGDRDFQGATSAVNHPYSSCDYLEKSNGLRVKERPIRPLRNRDR
jgi:multidrug resistance efflux pump